MVSRCFQPSKARRAKSIDKWHWILVLYSFNFLEVLQKFGGAKSCYEIV